MRINFIKSNWKKITLGITLTLLVATSFIAGQVLKTPSPNEHESKASITTQTQAQDCEYYNKLAKTPGLSVMGTDCPLLETTKEPVTTNKSQQLNTAVVPSGNSSVSIPQPACTTQKIPFKTIYRDAGWLDEGKTEKGAWGSDGLERICVENNKPPTKTTLLYATDEVIYRGTRKPY